MGGATAQRTIRRRGGARGRVEIRSVDAKTPALQAEFARG
jgi:hypothetical protein